jgi:hypothetical protein
VRGQPSPHGHDSHAPGRHLVQLGRLPIADEDADVVASRVELERGVEDETLGAPDAETGPEKGDPEGARGHRPRDLTTARRQRPAVSPPI